jgi:hypothetical protein
MPRGINNSLTLEFSNTDEKAGNAIGIGLEARFKVLTPLQVTASTNEPNS